MRGFAVDKNNDLHLGPDGNVAVDTGLAAVMRQCEHAMKAIMNEMVFSADRGMPYFEAIWTDAPNLRAFENVARGTLAALRGVTRVTEFNAEATGDVLAYRATIQTVYGDGTITGEVAGG